jgi:hypothetical protein
VVGHRDQALGISIHTGILEVTPNALHEGGGWHRNRLVPVAPAPVVNGSNDPLAARLPPPVRQDPVHFSPIDQLVDLAHRIVGAATWPKTIRALPKEGAVDDPQDLRQHPLYELILETGDTHRSGLSRPTFFRDVAPADRLMSIPLSPKPTVQVLKRNLQILSVVSLAHPIYADRRGAALPAEGA